MKAETFETIGKFFGKIKKIVVTSINVRDPFVELVARFSDNPGTVALLSGGDLDCAQYHILAVSPWLTVKGCGRNISLAVGGKTLEFHGDPFELLRRILDQYAVAFDNLSLPVSAGLFGYLSYDLKDLIEDLPRTSVDDHGLPQLCFFAPSVIFIHDKADNRTQMCVVEREDSSGLKTETGVDAIREILSGPVPLEKRFACGATGLKSSFPRSGYMDAVDKIKDYIVSGDIYQVNLSQRFETDFSGNPFAMFQALYQTAPSPFYAYIHAGDHWIVSTSPERFLKQTHREVETRPIKGTRPRGKNEVEDKTFSSDLLNSKKDDAELSMIVDLMRNDLGRVCKGGSVTVAEHKRLEAYHNVFHLVSVVNGELAADKGSVDLIKATFPGGSITGCPRIRSMEIIDELEPVRRHVYTGSIGYISFHDTLDLSVAIRTATIYKDRMMFSVGGGVVYDSDPSDEYEETLHKGRSLLGVLQSEDKEKFNKSKNWVWQNGKLTPSDHAVVPVSDLGLQYGLGFFETIRVQKSTPLFLEEHINRFYTAWTTLFETPVPDLTWEVLLDQVIAKNRLENEVAAVKIMATFGAPASVFGASNLLVSARKYSMRPAIIKNLGLGLITYPDTRQTPMADHKTLNYAYYYLAGKWAAQQGADEALILNPDGSISETNTANILLINGKKVIQPQSPHVLSGVMEKQVLGYFKAQGINVETKKLMPADLFSAEQVIMTNSLIGVVPVLSLDRKKLNSDPGFCEKMNGKLLKG